MTLTDFRTQSNSDTPPLRPISNDSRLNAPLVQHANISSVTAPGLLKVADSHVATDNDGYKRTDSYIGWRKEVAAQLLEYGLEKEARLFYDCADHPRHWIPSDRKIINENAATVWVCSEVDEHDAALFMPTCDLRICPDCAARQTARLAARYIPKAIELSKIGGRHKLRHIVFTTPIELTSDTPEKIHDLIKELSRLPRQALEIVQEIGVENGRDWQTIGAIQSAEFGTDGLKLHFHVIQYGAYVPQDVLSDAWKQVTGGLADIVYIRSIDNTSDETVQNDVIETLKYSVKFWSRDESGNVKYLPVNVMPHLLLALKGLRRIKSWGVFYKLPKPAKEPFCCPLCNAGMVRVGVENWQYWLDYGATYEDIQAWKRDSFLHLKLANKSKNLRENYEKVKDRPPPEVEKYRQKDLFSQSNTRLQPNESVNLDDL